MKSSGIVFTAEPETALNYYDFKFNIRRFHVNFLPFLLYASISYKLVTPDFSFEDIKYFISLCFLV